MIAFLLLLLLRNTNYLYIYENIFQLSSITTSSSDVLTFLEIGY